MATEFGQAAGEGLDGGASEPGDLGPEAEFQRQLRMATDRGMRLLGQREHSARQLIQKLCRKGFGRDVAEQATADLERLDVLSDDRFAEALIRRRIDRGYGPMYIRAELREAGINDERIDESLTRPADFWLQVAEVAREKKYGSLSGDNSPDSTDESASLDTSAPAEDGDWNRQARFLSRRGFPADLIYRTLRR